MFPRTASALIPYSRVLPLALGVAEANAVGAPLPPAAAPFGGPATRDASLGAPAPRSRNPFCPEGVQRNPPPAPERKSRRPSGSGLMRRLPPSGLVDDDGHLHHRPVQRAEELVGP